jgi:hypothetical protein
LQRDAVCIAAARLDGIRRTVDEHERAVGCEPLRDPVEQRFALRDVLEDADAFVGERREVARVEVGGAHERGIAGLLGEPSCNRARTRADLEAPRPGPDACGRDRVDAQWIGLGLQELQPLVLACEVLREDVFAQSGQSSRRAVS